jgi:hypothetical protein
VNDVSCPVLPGFQDGCKVTARQMAQSKGCRYKVEAGMPGFLLPSVNSWTQVTTQCFSPKAAFKYLLQTQFASVEVWALCPGLICAAIKEYLKLSDLKRKEIYFLLLGR